MNTLKQVLFDRIAPLLDDAVMTARTRLRPPTVKAHAGEPAAAAEERLRIALKSIFVPTTQARRIMKQLIGASIGFSATRYGGSVDYLRHVYNRDFSDDFPDATAICLTGLAGSGKSALALAIGRLLHIEEPIDVGGGHAPFVASHCINVNFRTHPSVSASLRQCAYSDAELAPARIQLDRLTKDARWRAFRDFSVLMFADECQFITHGSTSNARATSTLLTLLGLNVPLVYIANYSLCHNLMKRPQQDRHRLLSRPIVMQPESTGTQDWCDYLEECQRVAGPWLKVQARKHERQIFQLTFGIKRIVIDLICLAYRYMRQDGRESVTLEDLQDAYLSPENMHRSEVEALLAQMIGGIQPRSDLLCPFEVDSPLSAAAAHAREQQQKAIVATYSAEALNASERKALSQLEDQAAPVARKERSPAKNRKPPAAPLSASALLAADAKMRGCGQSTRS